MGVLILLPPPPKPGEVTVCSRGRGSYIYYELVSQLVPRNIGKLTMDKQNCPISLGYDNLFTFLKLFSTVLIVQFWNLNEVIFAMIL